MSKAKAEHSPTYGNTPYEEEATGAGELELDYTVAATSI